MRVILFIVILVFFFSCENRGSKDKNSNFNETKIKNLHIEDTLNNFEGNIPEYQEKMKTLFRVIKIDSLQNFYLIYTKKSDIDYKIVSEKVSRAHSCNKVKTGNYLSLELVSIVPDTSKISYKVNGVGYKGVEFEFEGDSIQDIYESKNFIGLCYFENVGDSKE